MAAVGLLFWQSAKGSGRSSSPAPEPGQLRSAPDGIIHIESPIERMYTLANFFDIWNEPLGRERVGVATGHVTGFNGRHYLGNPRDIPLLAHAQIQLDVGRPLVAPGSIQFPAGL